MQPAALDSTGSLSSQGAALLWGPFGYTWIDASGLRFIFIFAFVLLRFLNEYLSFVINCLALFLKRKRISKSSYKYKKVAAIKPWLN